MQELTQNLISSLEDTVEATEEHEVPLVGTCFEELAEVSSLGLSFLLGLHPVSCDMELYLLHMLKSMSWRS